MQMLALLAVRITKDMVLTCRNDGAEDDDVDDGHGDAHAATAA